MRKIIYRMQFKSLSLFSSFMLTVESDRVDKALLCCRVIKWAHRNKTQHA